MTMIRTQGARGGLTIAAQSIYESSSTKKHQLGTRLVLGNRVFHYALNGAAELTPAILVKSVAALKSEDTITVAHPIDTFRVRVTAASVIVNQYEDGILCVDEGTGVGQSYAIKDNTATDDPVTGVIECNLYDPLVTAWATADTDVTLLENIYRKVVICTTGAIELPVGVPLITIPANEYCWLQTWGPCGVKVDAAVGGGNGIDERVAVLSTNHAGQVFFLGTADVVEGAAAVGRCILNAADHGDDKVEPIWLTLNP